MSQSIAVTNMSSQYEYMSVELPKCRTCLMLRLEELGKIGWCLVERTINRRRDKPSRGIFVRMVKQEFTSMDTI